VKMTSYFPSQEAPAGAPPCNHSMWRKLFATITEGPTPRAEDAIAAFLHKHQHDLAPALWIELERRRLGP
jgi:hypothetical protein